MIESCLSGVIGIVTLETYHPLKVLHQGNINILFPLFIRYVHKLTYLFLWIRTCKSQYHSSDQSKYLLWETLETTNKRPKISHISCKHGTFGEHFCTFPKRYTPKFCMVVISSSLQTNWSLSYKFTSEQVAGRDRNCTGRCHDTCVGNMSRESGKGWLGKHIRLMKCTNRQGVSSHEVSERNRMPLMWCTFIYSIIYSFIRSFLVEWWVGCDCWGEECMTGGPLESLH